MTKSEETTDTEHNFHGAKAPPKAGFGKKLKRNCARWWWLYLFIFIALVLVIVLPIIYVGFPNKAQANVDDAELEITEQEIYDPKPDSIRLRQTAVTTSDSDNHPTLEEFEAALFLESTLPDIEPFGYITIPEKKYEDRTVVKIDQLVEIENEEQFRAYNQLVLGSEEFRVAIRGRTDLELGGLPETTVDFNKVATMKGLNGLQGLEITETRLAPEEQEDGANLLGTVSIPNPSVITIHMGNVTLNLSVDGEPIGTSLLPNFVLRPGTNDYELRSTVNTFLILRLIENNYPDAVLPLTIVGNSSIANGENLPYFEAAIQSNVIELELDAAPALAELGLDF